MSGEWYYTTDKQQMGPVSWDELRELAEVGILKPHDLVWADGMAEWVKAINQSGLFGDGDGAVTTSKKKPIPKPPPGRRASLSKDDDDDEDEEDEKEKKRQRRQREADRAKMGIGVKVGLILAGVLGLLLVCGCGCGGIGWLSMGGFGGKVNDPWSHFNIPERIHQEKSYRFKQGSRVIVTVNNDLFNPNTNVDVMVFRGNEQDQNRSLHWDRRLPAQDRNCRLEFIVPANDTYRIRVVNWGPGMANACHVHVQEQ